MERRAFIRLTALTGTSAALASCGHPEHQLIRFVPDEDIVQGVAEWRPSVCPLCAAGCGLTVRVMDADADVVRNGQTGVVRILAAKKLEGSPMNPVNEGGLCARGQAAIQLTYHPDRIAQPLRRAGDRGTGEYEPIAWDEAIGEVVSRLDAIGEPEARRAVAFLTQRRPSHRTALVERFLSSFGAQPAIVCEVFGDEVIRRANAISFGRDQLPTFDLGNARFVLSFGADLLGTWNAPVSHARAYGHMRQGRPGIRGAFVQVEPRMSQTGANADEWIPARPGTEGMLALGIAHALVASGSVPRQTDLGRAGAAIEGWRDGLPAYTPDRVAETTGVSAARIEQLARAMAGDGAVAMVAGAPLAHTNGLFTALAVNLLNQLAGAVGRPGGLFFTPQIDLTTVAGAAAPAAARATMAGLAAGILDGSAPVPPVVFLDGANPVFASPPAWRMADALARVPFIVSFGSFLDDSSALADLILPDHTFLEGWTDALPESGALVAVANAAGPAMRPLYDTRGTPDVLLEIGRRLRAPLDLPWQTFDELVTASLGGLPPRPGDFDTWSGIQTRGGWWGDLPSARAARPASPPAASPLAYENPRLDGDAGAYPFHFLPFPSPALYDGSLAHLPWLQEMPDPLTSAMWCSWIEINPSTAAALGIQDGDLVEVTSPHGTLRTGAVLSPGVAPDVVAMPVGQGHGTFTRYASGRGENPMAILAPLTEPSTGALAWAATRVRVSRAGPPDGRLILFAGGLREHVHLER